MTLNEPLLHTSTKHELGRLEELQPHALIVVGDSIANHNEVIGWLSTKADATIIPLHAPKIDDIRQLYTVTANKNTAASSRLICIEDAEQMTHEAQNALLKLLEEPVEGIRYLLASASVHGLLSTIQSRSHIVHLAQPPQNDYVDYLEASGHDRQAATAAHAANAGDWQGVQSYLSESGTHISQLAKQIISEEPYQRLKHVKQLSEDKAEALNVVRALLNIYRFLLKGKPGNTSFYSAVELCSDTLQAMSQNGNTKLLLSRLFTSL